MKIFAATLCLALSGVVQATQQNSTSSITLENHWSNYKIDSRIISGKDAQLGQFPWQAAVTAHFVNGNKMFCGGSLIAPGWVLTCAHCVHRGISWEIKIGGIVRTGLEPSAIIVSAQNGKIHEDFDSWSYQNDIALIKLNEDVPLSDTIQPIRLPGRSEVGDPLENLKVTASGWGKEKANETLTTFLRFVELNTITNKKCSEAYGYTIDNFTLCCIGHPEHSTCINDNGGALVRYDSDGKATQVGVVSFFHRNGCASGSPSGHVRTAFYLDWINKNTGIPIRD